MEIGDLRYLTVSADAGNFSRAANILGRNASTLSRRIDRLENELGLPLFERGRGSVRLTSGGKAVLVPVRRALAEIDAIKAAGIYVKAFARENGSFWARALVYGAVGALLSWSFTTLAVAAKNMMASVPNYLLIETAFTIAQWIMVAPLTVLAFPPPVRLKRQIPAAG
jgi:Bacterial regulatory helix-turn-helix protein, lysR family